MAAKNQPSIADLAKQIAELSLELENRKKTVKDELRQKIEQLLADNEASITDIYPELIAGKRKARGPKKGSRGPVSAKFRNPETNQEWTGRGRMPSWVATLVEARGITFEEFKKSPEFAA